MTFDEAVSEAMRRAELLDKAYLVAYNGRTGDPDSYMVLVDCARELPKHITPVQYVSMVECQTCNHRVWKSHRCGAHSN